MEIGGTDCGTESRINESDAASEAAAFTAEEHGQKVDYGSELQREDTDGSENSMRVQQDKCQGI
jgi:hypothetical protein